MVEFEIDDSVKLDDKAAPSDDGDGKRRNNLPDDISIGSTMSEGLLSNDPEIRNLSIYIHRARNELKRMKKHGFTQRNERRKEIASLIYNKKKRGGGLWFSTQKALRHVAYQEFKDILLEKSEEDHATDKKTINAEASLLQAQYKTMIYERQKEIVTKIEQGMIDYMWQLLPEIKEEKKLAIMVGENQLKKMQDSKYQMCNQYEDCLGSMKKLISKLQLRVLESDQRKRAESIDSTDLNLMDDDDLSSEVKTRIETKKSDTAGKMAERRKAAAERMAARRKKLGDLTAKEDETMEKASEQIKKISQSEERRTALLSDDEYAIEDDEEVEDQPKKDGDDEELMASDTEEEPKEEAPDQMESMQTDKPNAKEENGQEGNHMVDDSSPKEATGTEEQSVPQPSSVINDTKGLSPESEESQGLPIGNSDPNKTETDSHEKSGADPETASSVSQDENEEDVRNTREEGTEEGDELPEAKEETKDETSNEVEIQSKDEVGTSVSLDPSDEEVPASVTSRNEETAPKEAKSSDSSPSNATSVNEEDDQVKEDAASNQSVEAQSAEAAPIENGGAKAANRSRPGLANRSRTSAGSSDLLERARKSRMNTSGKTTTGSSGNASSDLLARARQSRATGSATAGPGARPTARTSLSASDRLAARRTSGAGSDRLANRLSTRRTAGITGRRAPGRNRSFDDKDILAEDGQEKAEAGRRPVLRTNRTLNDGRSRRPPARTRSADDKELLITPDEGGTIEEGGQGDQA